MKKNNIDMPFAFFVKSPDNIEDQRRIYHEARWGAIAPAR